MEEKREVLPKGQKTDTLTVLLAAPPVFPRTYAIM